MTQGILERPSTAERLATLETLVKEVHAAVVGDGQHTLAARVAVNEAEIANLKSWRHKTIASAAQTVLSACVSLLTLTLGAHH